MELLFDLGQMKSGKWTRRERLCFLAKFFSCPADTSIGDLVKDKYKNKDNDKDNDKDKYI